MKNWELKRSDVEHVNDLLKKGWEPFAVSFNNGEITPSRFKGSYDIEGHDVIWLRRQIKS